MGANSELAVQIESPGPQRAVDPDAEAVTSAGTYCSPAGIDTYLLRGIPVTPDTEPQLRSVVQAPCPERAVGLDRKGVPVAGTDTLPHDNFFSRDHRIIVVIIKVVIIVRASTRYNNKECCHEITKQSIH